MTDNTKVFKLDREALINLTGKDNVDKWVTALRSGKYIQIRSKMASEDIPNSACCLHVAAIEVDGVKWEDAIFNDTVIGLPSGFHESINASFSELLANFGRIRVCSQYNNSGFSRLNDFYKLSFEQIAELIEEGELCLP